MKIGILILLMSLIACSNNSNLKDSKISSTNDLINIVELASLAPSSHNAQMWKVKIINENEVNIIWDSSKKLESSDPNNKEALISIGAFIENFVQGAKVYGFDTTITLNETFGINNEVANLKLIKKEFSNTYNILNNIRNRHTIRESYLDKVLEQNDLNSLLISENIKYFDKNSEQGKYLKNALYESYVKESYNKNTQQELSKWIITSNKEAKNRNDGMRAEMMGMGGIKKYFYYAFINKKSVEEKMFINKGIEKAKNQSENCSGYIILTANSEKNSDFINLGREFEKLFLIATEKKIAIHPMSQIFHESPWKDEISEKLGLNNHAELLLRVGYVSEYGKPTSLRNNVNDIIIF